MSQKRQPELIYDTFKGSKADLRRPAGFSQGFTLVLTFSRPWCVPPFFSRFQELEMDLDQCHLLIVDNTIFSNLRDLLLERAKAYTPFFKSVRVLKTYEDCGGFIKPAMRQMSKGSPGEHTLNCHINFIKHVTTRRFVCIEDDTLPTINAIPRLLQLLKSPSHPSISTGIETTRSTDKYSRLRLGVHYTRSVGYKIIERLSPPPHKKGIYEVDACGWFCFASYTHLWQDTLEEVQKHLDEIPFNMLDTVHTNLHCKAGHKIMADFSISCTHMASDSKIIHKCTKDRAIPQVDIYLPTYDVWQSGIPIPWDNDTLNCFKLRKGIIEKIQN